MRTNTIKEPALQEHIDRVGIEFYSRWKDIKLGKLINVINGFAFKSTDFLDTEKPNSLPIIKIKNVANGDVNLDGVHFHLYTDSLNKYIVLKNDILISLTGNHPELETQVVGLVSRYKLDSKALLNQRVAKLESKNQNELCNDYLYYFLKNKDTHLLLASQSSGSANQANISKTNIEDIPFSKPPIQEQTTIASILSSLDDKIDLLQRQNKTLEQLAETLFRQMMSELGNKGLKDDRMINKKEILQSSNPKNHNSDNGKEAEGRWKVGKLGEVFDIGIGRTPPRKEKHWFTANPNDLKWVSIKDMGTSGIYIDTVSEYLTPQAVEAFSVPIIPENTVMLSFKMTIGRLAISTEKMVSNEAIAHFKQKEGSSLFPEFLYLFLKTYSWVELGSTSSIVESINSQMIKEIEMIIPDKQKLIDFKELVKPTFDKIKSNQTQIRTLTQTRDALLPKLMSGEVRVKMSEL